MATVYFFRCHAYLHTCSCNFQQHCVCRRGLDILFTLSCRPIGWSHLSFQASSFICKVPDVLKATGRHCLPPCPAQHALLPLCAFEQNVPSFQRPVRLKPNKQSKTSQFNRVGGSQHAIHANTGRMLLPFLPRLLQSYFMTWSWRPVQPISTAFLTQPVSKL